MTVVLLETPDPSSAVAVITALPCPTPVIFPLLVTLTTEGLLEVQLTFLFAALDGDIDALSVVDLPFLRYL
jgi:hypothetical protein